MELHTFVTEGLSKTRHSQNTGLGKKKDEISIRNTFTIITNK
jgi:hypothetical protein